MKRKTRRIIFWLLVFLFAAATPAIIGYSIGYRFDWETKKIVVTGSLFIKAKPSQARIFLNEKLKKETSMIWNSALISNLKPKNYDIRVEKDGFWPWRKNLSIKPELVTEARNILLFPKEPAMEKLLDDKIIRLWPSPDSSKIIYFAENGGAPSSVSPDLKIYDLKTTAEIAVDKTDVCPLAFAKTPENKLISAADGGCRAIWSQKGDKVLMRQTKEPERWRLIEIDWQNGTAMNYPIFQKPYKTENKKFETLPVNEAMFDPKNSDIIFYSLSGRIYSLDIESGLVSRFSSEETAAFAIFDDSIFYLSEKSPENSIPKHPEIYLFRSSKDGKQKTELGSMPVDLKTENRFASAKISISQNGEITILAGQTLYRLDQKTGKFAEIAKNTAGTSFSPDGKKMLYFGENEINAYYFEKILIQPYKKAGDADELARLSEKIESALWHAESGYVIFWAGGKIKIAELDDRDEINIIDFLNAENPLIFYDENAAELYFLDKQTLFKTEI